jgi:hypothetical protein
MRLSIVKALHLYRHRLNMQVNCCNAQHKFGGGLDATYNIPLASPLVGAQK